jgi:hypothetical protein
MRSYVPSPDSHAQPSSSSFSSANSPLLPAQAVPHVTGLPSKRNSLDPTGLRRIVACLSGVRGMQACAVKLLPLLTAHLLGSSLN